ncbi:hypothetical protein [Sphingosinicella sp. CPCC 101087]|uniref:hypothetical protein n=1 Tax=Sphingosinicella sp. CPCC 101087 TaxID=2497754 RepID=UPI00101B76D8|nr:hypothetical protein [Sphingosinicella sp. CPCC 101087]
MDGTIGGAPGFSLPVLVALSCLLAIPLYLAGRTLRGDAARFLIAAVWLRYILSVFHEVTYQQVVGGLSLNAIGSVLVTAAGLLVINKRYLMLKALLPVYALIAIAMASAQLNGSLLDSLDTVVKYLYFCTLFIATFEALQDNAPGLLFRRLLIAFAPLLVFQLLSIATGVVKASELDGSRSYIGGYNHEAAFSVALATFFVVAAFATGMNRVLKFVLLAVLMTGIALANYRTTIIAMLPFVAHLAVSRSTRLFLPRQRLFLGAAALGATLAAVVVAAILSEGRFGELADFLSRPGTYIKPQEEFGLEERRLLSGRVYIWSGYIHTWIESSQMQHLIGFGPDNWSEWFRVYPHNTLIAYLFELGLIGLAVLIWWWAAMLRLARRALRPFRADLLFAQISFILLNLATMALWQIEGLILFSIVCGYSMFRAQEARIALSGRRREPLPREAIGGTGLVEAPGHSPS